MSWNNRVKKWANRRASGADAGRQKREASIIIDSERLRAFNGFTETLDETFRKGRWHIVDSPFTVSYHAPNPLGDVTGLIVRFDVYMKGVHMWHFIKTVTSVKATEDLRFKVTLDKSETLEIDAKRSSWIPKPPTSEFKVVVQSYEFFIPKGNPLYSDDEVRDAAGLPRVEREETIIDEFAALCAGFTGDLRGYADDIISNLEQIERISADDPEMRKKADRFIGKYIPLLNDMLKGYEGDVAPALAAGGSDHDKGISIDEVRETLRNMAHGSANFIRKLQSKSEMDSEVAKTVIEQQLIADGLIDPMKDR